MCNDNKMETWSVEKFVVWFEFCGRTSFLHRNSRHLVEVYGDGVIDNAACQYGRTGVHDDNPIGRPPHRGRLCTGTIGLTDFGKPTNRNSGFIRSFGVANWDCTRQVHEELDNRKVYVRRAPGFLLEGEKYQRCEGALSHLRFIGERIEFFVREWLVMGHGCTLSLLKGKQAGMQGKQLHREPKQEKS